MKSHLIQMAFHFDAKLCEDGIENFKPHKTQILIKLHVLACYLADKVFFRTLIISSICKMVSFFQVAFTVNSTSFLPLFPFG